MSGLGPEVTLGEIRLFLTRLVELAANGREPVLAPGPQSPYGWTGDGRTVRCKPLPSGSPSGRWLCRSWVIACEGWLWPAWAPRLSGRFCCTPAMGTAERAPRRMGARWVDLRVAWCLSLLERCTRATEESVLLDLDAWRCPSRRRKMPASTASRPVLGTRPATVRAHLAAGPHASHRLSLREASRAGAAGKDRTHMPTHRRSTKVANRLG